MTTISTTHLRTEGHRPLRRLAPGRAAAAPAAQAQDQVQPEEQAAAAQEGQAAAQQEQAVAQATDRGSDVERGRELFFANGCNICHGDTGGGGIGPTIAQTLFSVDQVIQQYRTPRAFMPAFPADLVPDADVGDIQAWLQTLSLPDSIVPGEGTP